MQVFTWQAPEYAHEEKTQDWYWVVGIIAAGVAVTSLIFGNFVFAILVIVAAFVLCLFAARKPRTITVEVNHRGVKIEEAFYPFRSLLSFWIEDEHRHGSRLILRSNRTVAPYIILPAPQDREDLEQLREILEDKLSLEEYKENFLHAFFDWLWF